MTLGTKFPAANNEILQAHFGLAHREHVSVKIKPHR